MTPLAVIFLLANAIALLALPRRLAPIPLMIGTCYMTYGQGVIIAGANFPVYRLLIVIGLLRCLFRGERPLSPINLIDKLLGLLVIWLLFASLFHEQKEGSGFVYAIGAMINLAGVYMLMRIWSSDPESLKSLLSVLAILLFPIAIEMAFEKLTGRNLFSVFGRVPEQVMVRGGSLRAQGPFPHPILAGTVGATTFPLMIALWQERRIISILGIFSCLVIIFASASSGPIMSFGAGIFAILLWNMRGLTKALRWGAVAAYLVLEVVMTRPPYYLISKIDLTGSSTAYFRSKLIESSINHLNEWWLFGTDFTRHWMPTGVTFSENHTDITNYYIAFGVNGGLLALSLLLLILWASFKRVGKFVESNITENRSTAFLYWCLGSALFAHAATSISVAYFGQSSFFFWLSIAIIASLSDSKISTRENIA